MQLRVRLDGEGISVTKTLWRCNSSSLSKSWNDDFLMHLFEERLGSVFVSFNQQSHKLRNSFNKCAHTEDSAEALY